MLLCPSRAGRKSISGGLWDLGGQVQLVDVILKVSQILHDLAKRVVMAIHHAGVQHRVVIVLKAVEVTVTGNQVQVAI